MLAWSARGIAVAAGLLPFWAFAAGPAAAPAGLLVLPVVAEGAEVARSAEVQQGLESAVEELGLTRIPAEGPTFCNSTDERCIADAGRKSGATQVLFASVRPVGETTSVLLLLVPTAGGASRRHVEAFGAGVALAPVVRAGVVRLLAPERYVGALFVEAADGSELWLDGARLGTTPLAAPVGGLTPGQHMLRVVRPGGAEARSYVEIRFDTTTRVKVAPRSDELALVGFDSGATAPVAAGEPAPGAAPVDGGGSVDGLTVAKWALLGVGVAALAGGAYFVNDSYASADSFAALRDENGQLPASRQAEWSSLRDDSQSSGTTATVLFVAGGAALVGSAAIFLFDLDEGGPQVAPAVAPGAAGLSLTIRR